MGSLSNFFSAKVSNIMPNIRDPAIATKKFARNDLDNAFGLSTYTNMKSLYDQYTQTDFVKGDKKSYLTDATKFVNYIRGKMFAITNAEGGTINLMRSRIQFISGKAQNIESNLAKMKRNIPQREFGEVVDNMHKRWLEINHVIVEDVLSNMIKLQKNIEYGRNQMITQSFRFDFSMKKDVAFFFHRDINLRKNEKSLFKSIEKDIKLLSSLDSLKITNKNMDSLSKVIIEEMNLIQNELRDLTILLINMTESVSLIERAVLDSLIKSGLDNEGVNVVKKQFDDLREFIKQDSAVNVERLKQLIPAGQGIR